MKIQLKADLALAAAAMFWGASCLLTKFGLGEIKVFNLIALRFIIGFFASVVLFHKSMRGVEAKTVKYAAALSAILFCVLAFSTFGVKYTSASNAGFLTCLAGVFIPVIAYFFFRQALNGKILISILLAFTGMFLLTMNEQLRFNVGDVLCALCSVAFAVYVILMEKFTKDVDSVSLGVLQLGFVGLYSLIFSFILEAPGLPATVTGWYTVLILSLLCTAFGFITQTVAQKYTSATHTGLIFSLEPVFAVAFAFVFAGEILPLSNYMGAAMLLVSIFLVET